MIKKYFYSLAILFTIFQSALNAQTINTLVGTFTGDGYNATSIGLNPVGQAMDAAGNLYIAVPDRHVVVKLSTAGIYSTVAGTGIYGFKGDGGPATSALLKNPWKVAVDGSGNIYIADNYDHRIRKVSSSGIITTIAGNGAPGFSGDGGPATAAKINGAVAVEVDGSGNLFIADYVNRRVRKITPAGIISTVAGNGVSGRGGDNGPAKSAQLGYVSAIALNSAGEIFIGDNTFGIVRKVDANGIITTVAGTGTYGFSGDGGLATVAKFNAINGVAVDRSGNIFIADTYNNRIRKVNTSGIVTTLAGTGGTGFTGDGKAATTADIKAPRNVAVDNAGNVLISSNFRVRQVTVSTGIINTIAGNGSGGYCGDNGPVTKSQIYHPVGVAADGSGNIYIVDRENCRIRKVNSAGVITTVAGSGSPGFSGDGGAANLARLNLPTSVAVDRSGNLFITDYGNNRIRKVATNGIITTIAGLSGGGGWTGDGLASAAKLWGPDGITTDAAGDVYFADQYNNRIRKITTTGTIITVAGKGTQGFAGDNGPALLASLYWPNGVTVDKSGNVFFTDRRNNRVRKVSTAGIITTVAGNGGQAYNGDGKSALLAGLDPASVAVDPAGNIFISDNKNERIRRVNTSGMISTLAGKGATFGDGGISTDAQVHTPNGIGTDPSGNLYVSDYDDHRIRKISLVGVTLSRSIGPITITDEAATPLKFSMYPNPVQNTLYIQTPRGAGLTHVEVIDVEGKILLSKKVEPSQSVITVQLNRLAPGSYLVRTTGSDNTINVKEIIKQ
ncbi:MAG: T9SS type A sorting domain-containing protein [Ferruginibacter sp.]